MTMTMTMTMPNRAEPSRAEPSRTEPNRAEPNRTEPSGGPSVRASVRPSVRPTVRPSRKLYIQTRDQPLFAAEYVISPLKSEIPILLPLRRFAALAENCTNEWTDGRTDDKKK